MDIDSTPTTPVVMTTEEPANLTNKEKRKWRQEQRKLAAEKEQEKIQSQSNSTTDPDPTSKRKRDQDTATDALKDSTTNEEGEAAPAGGAQGEGEEMEALSHKEKRKRRKMEKSQAKFFGSSESNEPRPTSSYPVGPGASGAPPSGMSMSDANRPARSEFSLWIANMSFQTSPQRIQEWLEEKGIKGISRVHMPKGERRGQYSKGFCYVDVPSQETLEFGISLSESHLDGRRLLIKSGSDYKGRPAIDPLSSSLALSTVSGTTPVNPNHTNPNDEDEEEGDVLNPRGRKTGLTKTAQKILRSQKHPAGPTLFVGNLSFESTEEGVREMVERATKAREERDEVWGKSAKEKARKEKKEKRKEKNNEEKRKRKEAKKLREANGEESESEEEEKKEESEDEESEGSSGESSDEEEVEVKEGGKKEKKEKKEKKPAPLRGAGIRKIRMGTFEDTGKCKGFAFIDFHSSAHATATLLDTRNTFLDGRTLILQYAGADAIRRGGIKGSGSAATAKRHSRLKNGDSGSFSNSSNGFSHHKETEESEPLGPAPVPGSFDPDAPLPKKHKETQEERAARRAAGGKPGGNDYKKRAKPGAALSMAKRENVGIVESEGKKTSFE